VTAWLESFWIGDTVRVPISALTFKESMGFELANSSS
jgi:hypothetical protein